MEFELAAVTCVPPAISTPSYVTIGGQPAALRSETRSPDRQPAISLDCFVATIPVVLAPHWQTAPPMSHERRIVGRKVGWARGMRAAPAQGLV